MIHSGAACRSCQIRQRMRAALMRSRVLQPRSRSMTSASQLPDLPGRSHDLDRMERHSGNRLARAPASRTWRQINCVKANVAAARHLPGARTMKGNRCRMNAASPVAEERSTVCFNYHKVVATRWAHPCRLPLRVVQRLPGSAPEDLGRQRARAGVWATLNDCGSLVACAV